MPTDCHSNWMTFDDQMAEVAGILAAGILRMRRNKMSQTTRDSSLANTMHGVAEESAHCATQPVNGGSR